MVMRPALTPDQLPQLNFDRIIRRTTWQSLPLSYFKRATELLGEDSFPLKSKSALRLYVDSDFKSLQWVWTEWQTVPEPYYIYLIWQKHFLGWIDINILTVIRDQSNSIQWTFPVFSMKPYSREEGTPPLWSGCHQLWIQMRSCQMQSPKENIRRRQPIQEYVTTFHICRLTYSCSTTDCG